MILIENKLRYKSLCNKKIFIKIHFVFKRIICLSKLIGIIIIKKIL